MTDTAEAADTIDVTADDSARIHVVADPPSSRPPLVFSNSLGTDHRMWDAQLAAARRHFRVIRYDSRGHGGSDAPGGEYTIERLGRDVLAILDALEIERTNFCGLSMGGMVGMWLGSHAPERIGRLALVSTAAQMGDRTLWQDRIATVRAKGLAPVAAGNVDRWFSKPFQARGADELARIEAMILATSPAGYAACCAAIRDMDQRADLPRITAPTLVVAGSADPATPPPLMEAIRDAIPGAEYLLVPDVAHLLNIEVPALFEDAVLGFLAR